MKATADKPVRLNQYTIEDALTAAHGDPERALTLILRLIDQGILKAGKHGLHTGSLPVELRAAA